VKTDKKREAAKTEKDEDWRQIDESSGSHTNRTRLYTLQKHVGGFHLMANEDVSGKNRNQLMLYLVKTPSQRLKQKSAGPSTPISR